MPHFQGFSSQRQTPFVIFSYNVYVFQLGQQPISFHSIFSVMLPVLLSFLQIQCSASFELHPIITKASIGCLVTYYVAFGAKFMFPAYASHFNFAMFLSGSFCVVALVSLNLQIPWWSILIVLLLIGGLLLLVLKFYGIHNAHAILPRPRRTPRHLLPL